VDEIDNREENNDQQMIVYEGNDYDIKTFTNGYDILSIMEHEDSDRDDSDNNEKKEKKKLKKDKIKIKKEKSSSLKKKKENISRNQYSTWHNA